VFRQKRAVLIGCRRRREFDAVGLVLMTVGGAQINNTPVCPAIGTQLNVTTYAYSINVHSKTDG